MGVLDARLRPYGTQNLRVGDLSICPDNLGTNTYSSALMIAEKCAHMGKSNEKDRRAISLCVCLADTQIFLYVSNSR